MNRFDYHIHYYLDSCAASEMTFENINQKCCELGISECSVLKHYSAAMPNGKDAWICWKRVKQPEWERYLAESAVYKPVNGTRFFSGVESELCNESGDINIPAAEAAKIDMIALSVHYMIALDGLPMDLMLYPNLNFCPESNNAEGEAEIARYAAAGVRFGAENVVSGLVRAYINAIKRHKKIRSLAHMYD